MIILYDKMIGKHYTAKISNQASNDDGCKIWKAT